MSIVRIPSPPLFTYGKKENVEVANFFTNCWCSEWLFINGKVMLVVGPNENQEEFAILIVCKSYVKKFVALALLLKKWSSCAYKDT